MRELLEKAEKQDVKNSDEGTVVDDNRPAAPQVHNVESENESDGEPSAVMAAAAAVQVIHRLHRKKCKGSQSD